MFKQVRSSSYLLPAVLVLLALLAGLMPGALTARETTVRQEASRAAAGRVLFLPMIANAVTTAEPPLETQLEVVLRPVPLREVERGKILSVEFRATNIGTTRISLRNIAIVYNLNQMRLVDTALAPGDILFGYDYRLVNVVVKNIQPGETRTGRVNFRVNEDLAIGSLIVLSTQYECGGRICSGNQSEVQVIAANGDDTDGRGGTYTMGASPDRGPAGTRHRFSSDHFHPDEQIVTWINTPSGVRPLSLTATADRNGRIQLEYRSDGLTPGAYSLVAHGRSSNVEAVGAFIVTAQHMASGPALMAAPVVAGRATMAARPAGAPVLTQPASGSGGIGGRVSAADGGAGLADVLVVAINDANQPVASTRTREDGTYFIAGGLAGGSYRVEFQPGLSTSSTTQTYVDAALDQVTVTEPNLTAGVDIALTRGVAVSGRVTAAENGTGLAQVLVSLVNSGGNLAGTALTGADGTYSIPGIASGTYTVTFDPATALDTAAQAYAAAAQGGVVVGTSNVGGVDRALARPTASGLISGRVTGQDNGLGLADVLVIVNEQATNRLVDVVTTDDQGNYLVGPLAGGSYLVGFLPLFSSVPTTTAYVGAFYSGNPVVVPDTGTVAGIDAALTRGGAISGTVTGANNASLAEVLVAAVDTDGELAGLAISASDGSYQLSGLASGNYRVAFLPGFSSDEATAAYHDAFYNNRQDLETADAVAVTAPNTTADINAALTNGGRVSGRVSAADGGQGLADVLVAFYDAQANLVDLVISGEDGSYSSSGLPSGAYKVEFSTVFSPEPAANYIDQFYNNQPAFSSATAITLTAPADIANIDAVLVRGGAISGRVSAADSGAGLRGVAVFVYNAADALVRIAVSDDNGDYLISGLAPGAYRLNFDPSSAFDAATRAYQAEFYNDKADLAGADPVTVTSTALTGGINAALAPNPQR